MSSNTSSRLKTDSGPSSPPPARDRYALTGQSQDYDPRTTPARKDLADVALAGRLFAPHYAKAMAAVATVETQLRAAIGDESETLEILAPGARFRVLEITDHLAWGQAEESGLVGYVDRHALDAA